MQKSISVFLIVLFAAVRLLADDPPQPAVQEKLDRYVQSYCNAGNLSGPSLLEGPTYFDDFLERLRETKDNELKRLFVLASLHGTLREHLTNFELNRVWTGKIANRKMTKNERASARAKIVETLDDLSLFDPSDSKKVVAELRARLDRASSDHKK